MSAKNQTKMQVPLLNLRAQYKSMKNEIGSAIQKILDNQSFILGPEVQALENEVARYCGTRYAVGVASGTDALFLSLKAMSIGDGDEVITTPFTFIATGGAIHNTGARPVFADIDPRTFNIDPSKIKERITKKTKALMPVHLYGLMADMDAINAVAKEADLKVIEDNAQGIGATYKGKVAGSMSDAGCISFFPGKNLGSYGDAGMVVTDDEKLAKRIKVIRVHGSTSKYIHETIGYNSRLDNLQAAILLVKLKYLDGWTRKRQENAAYYNANLKGLPLITTPHVPEHRAHVYHQYTIRVARVRNGLMDHLNEHGIEARIYYPIPLHLQECFKQLGYKKGDFPEAERAMDEALSLPVDSELSSEQKEYIVATIREFFSK
ncbi:MAG: DegT/DnrJ/EryC1/StrS family aminotransferase [Candidatus Omnitrophica bacterium]|nr:DegT/DnrJ/EryC1/StrS family aminotransferase [Candidatus Omnitrophota bacterium]